MSKKLVAREIIPGLLWQSGEFWREPLLSKVSKLETLGIQRLVCLTKHKDDELAQHMGDNYWYFYIQDGKNIDTPKLFYGAIDVGGWLEQGIKVLCHCQVGKNRSSLFNALLCIRILGISGKDAVQHMRSCRRGSLDNETFVKFLESIEKYSKSLNSYIFRK